MRVVRIYNTVKQKGGRKKIMAYKAYVGSYSEPDVVDKICKDIKQRDSSFRYKIMQPFGKLKNKYKCILQA